MSGRGWSIRIEVYPHSSGDGAERDIEACGGRFHDQLIFADGADEALSRASLIALGIAKNPRVWQANIVKIEVCR